MNTSEKNKIIEKHYRENYDRCVGFCNRLFQNTAHAEDVVQEAYKRSIEYYSNADDFDKWFNTIISNCIRDKWRTELNHGMGLLDEDVEIPVKAHAIPAILYKEVVTAIGKYPEPASTILRLFLLEQHKTKEIEQITNERPAIISRVVHQFRQEMKRDYKWTF